MQRETSPNKKLYYGWVVAIAAGVVAFATANFQYTFGVFVKPLADSFGWSRAEISAATTFRSATSMVFAPLVGAWSDRHGPKPFMLAGVILVGLSYLAASRITSLWQLYASLGFMIGLGLTFGFLPALATVTRWFGKKSALPVGIVMSGFGVAQILLPPLATQVILRYGMQVGFVALALVVWVIGIIAWRFVRNPPPGTQPPAAKADRTRANPAAVPESDFTAREAMRNSIMWVLIVINMGLMLCYQAMVIHVVPAAIQVGVTPGAAALILTFSGVTNTFGRLALSALTTRIETRLVLLFCFALQAVSVFSLAIARELYVFYLGAMVYGLAYGGVIAIMPSLTGVYFGTRAVGAIYSFLNVAQNVGMAIGPLLAGYIFDVTGSYFVAFASAAVSLSFMTLLCLWLKPPAKRSS